MRAVRFRVVASRGDFAQRRRLSNRTPAAAMEFLRTASRWNRLICRTAQPSRSATWNLFFPRTMKLSETPPPAAAPKEDPLAAVAGFKNAHEKVLAEIGKVIVGQREVLNQMLVALFARGHCLLIGVPGLAKTLMVRTLGSAIDLGFQPHPVHARPHAGGHHRHGHSRRRSRHRQTRVPFSSRADFHATCCSPTKSTARRPRRRPRCSKPCRNIA